MNGGDKFSPVLLAGENGRLYRYDVASDRLSLVFQDSTEERLMGLSRRDDLLYLGADSRIHRFRVEGTNLHREQSSSRHSGTRFGLPYKKPDFHQSCLLRQSLLISATRTNEIWEFDLDLNLKHKHPVAPPSPLLPVVNGWNYNHLNCVYPHGGHYYVGLNWLDEQYGPSGVAVLDDSMEEIDRFQYGWETHNFRFYRDQPLALCGSSGAIKTINHPHRAGLLLDGEFVFEHDPSEAFNKDFEITEEGILVAGGTVSRRSKRINADGILYFLDDEFRLLDVKVFDESGGFCGVLSL